MSEHPGRTFVLVVDDYPDCCEMYAECLGLAGFDVIKGRNGVEAVELARRYLPDVILMDLSLPVLDGCQATRQLKSDPRTRNLPVIALTAQSHPTPQSLRGMGFDDVIIKPCLPDELAEKVRRAAASRRRLEPVS